MWQSYNPPLSIKGKKFGCGCLCRRGRAQRRTAVEPAPDRGVPGDHDVRLDQRRGARAACVAAGGEPGAGADGKPAGLSAVRKGQEPAVSHGRSAAPVRRGRAGVWRHPAGQRPGRQPGAVGRGNAEDRGQRQFRPAPGSRGAGSVSRPQCRRAGGLPQRHVRRTGGVLPVRAG
ncbi:hypothetical protein D3C72_1808450 [compost metagenome]